MEKKFGLQKCGHKEKSNYGINLSIILMLLTIYGVGKSQCDRSKVLELTDVDYITHFLIYGIMYSELVYFGVLGTNISKDAAFYALVCLRIQPLFSLMLSNNWAFKE